LPDRLKEVSDEIDNSLSAVAIIDGARIALNRDEDVWLGQTSRPANSDFLISYTFTSSFKATAKLANWEERRNAGETGTTIDVASSEYRYDFDSDGDGLDNLEEIVLGTNPEDKNDPRPNPCANSNFDAGCNVDTDEDGTPDSVETESADEDEDSIPDYLESKNDDADDDGFNAELDRDETDPCIPSDQTIACQESNQNEPPVVDPPMTDPPMVDPPVVEPPEASLLSYGYYEGRFETMPDFDRLTPTSTGTAETFSLPPSDGAKFYALQYTGKIFIAEPGAYTFYTESNDGSLLYINGNVIVDNDGTHSLREASGTVALDAGLHDIVVEYFQNNGSEALTVSWSSSKLRISAA